MKAFTLRVRCFLYFILWSLSKADVTSQRYTMEPSLDNKVSDIDLMAKHNSESLTGCSAMCGKPCACFGFNPQLKKCRIHRSCDQSDMTRDETGWRYYYVDGVGCHVGWIQFRYKCYWFSQDAKPWVEAKGICALNHTKLAEPRTANESSFLISHTQRNGGIYWIGISDMIEEGKWIYSSDQTVIQVNDFHPGEPNHHTVANCVALCHCFDGKWVDEPCGENYRFICETEIE
ncbi:perlucin-like [Ostrea edulis]|uniref:perlucin-like n=1 Tax=Ostrea edulis TaxID=37623 RepID=UPI0024AE9112|nr:perlucin-like [Ostrea edulis]